MNRNAINDFTADITASSDLDLSSEYIIFSSPSDNPADLDDGPTYGIWVFEEGQRTLVADTLKDLFEKASQAASAPAIEALGAGDPTADNIDSLPPSQEAGGTSINVDDLFASAERPNPRVPTSSSNGVSSDPGPVDESASLMSMLGLGSAITESKSPAPNVTARGPAPDPAPAPAPAPAAVSVPALAPGQASRQAPAPGVPVTKDEHLAPSPAVGAPVQEPMSPSPRLLRSVVQAGLASREVPGAPKLPRREFVTALLNRIHTEPQFVDQLYADYVQRP